MSSCVNLILKPKVSLKDFFIVAGILYGCEKIKSYNQNDLRKEIIDVKGVKFRYGFGETDVDGFYDGGKWFQNFLLMILNNDYLVSSMNIHLDFNEKGEKLITGSSAPFEVALCLRLVNIFGGSLILNDNVKSDDEEWIRVKKGSFKSFFTSDPNEGFLSKHQFFKNLKPLTEKDLIAARNLAAYKLNNNEFEKILIAFASVKKRDEFNLLNGVIKNHGGINKKMKV
jgi:hypothetical protein